MKFTPFKFQLPLAAGGITLMAFNYLQFAVPHGKGLIKLSDIPWGQLTTGQTVLYLPLIGIMTAFAIINFIFILVFLKSLLQWRFNNDEYTDFINSPPTTTIGIFVPVASLSMTANVILVIFGFFFSKGSSNIQALMLPALIFYGVLWVTLFVLEFNALKMWLTKPLDSTKLNFVWLIDVFAFGLVNLTGTGIASMSSNREIASIAAFASFIALSVGVFLLVAKLGYLLYLQIKSSGLPQNPVLPSFFLVIPITCLFGISFYRIAQYLHTFFQFDIKALSFFLINFSYVVTIGWGIFTLYLISSYFTEYFYQSEFAAPQWAMV